MFRPVFHGGMLRLTKGQRIQLALTELHPPSNVGLKPTEKSNQTFFGSILQSGVQIEM
jgi:hypothetical protein